MRRSIVRKKFFLILFLIVSILSIVVSAGYAYFSSSLNIGGVLKGKITIDNYVIDPNSDLRLSISGVSRNRWFEGNLYKYQYSFDISNTTSQDITSFIVELTFNASISNVNIWNYDYTIADNKMTITDSNSNLSGNKKAKVSFIVSSTSPLLTMTNVKLAGIDANSNEEFTDAQLPVQFNLTNSWGTYVYQYDVKITNKTGKKLSAWSIEIPLPSNTTRTGGWNADFKMEDQTLIISSLSYNSILNKNDTVSVGLQITTDISNYVPIVSKRFGR